MICMIEYTYECGIIIILIIFILKFDFQIPYNNNIIFAQNVLFFSINVIFVEFSIKRYILFILVNNSFLENPDLNLKF